MVDKNYKRTSLKIFKIGYKQAFQDIIKFQILKYYKRNLRYIQIKI